MEKILRSLAPRVAVCMSREDRKDVEFRHLITSTEIGDLLHFINFGGAREDEQLAFGQAIVQLVALTNLRGLDLMVMLKLPSPRLPILEDLGSGRLGQWVRFAELSGSLEIAGKYITHDPSLNAGARPYKTKAEETEAYWNIFYWLNELIKARGLEFEKCAGSGLANWEDSDWRRKMAHAENKETMLRGVTVLGGVAGGVVYVVDELHSLNKVPRGSILVAEVASSDAALYAGRLVALVTDQGGATSHAASIARDRNLPCLVGTGNATKLLLHGKEARIEITSEGIAQIMYVKE